MLPYIIIFAISIFFAAIADRCFQRRRAISIVFLILIVAINSVFCGLRDWGIGTDTNVYIDNYFDFASYIKSIKDIFRINYGDMGFVFLAYIANWFSKDAQSLLVVTEVWIIGFVMAGAYVLKKHESMRLWIFMFLFCFMFYGHTLNLMRQYCAMAILFYGFALLRAGKFWVYVLTQVIAFFLHSTSIIFIVVPIIYYISRINDFRLRNIYAIVTMVSSIVVVYYFYYFLALLGGIGVVSDLYVDRYGANSEYGSSEGSGRLTMLSYLLTLYTMWVAYRKKALDNEKIYMTVILYILVVLLSQLVHLTTYLNRLSHYINLAYSSYLVYIYDSRKIPLLLKYALALLCVFFCWRIFVLSIGGEIYPYKSRILGI